MIRTPAVPVTTPILRPLADSLARHVARFARSVERVLLTHREAVLRRQLVPGTDRQRRQLRWSRHLAPWPASTCQLVAKSAVPGDREAAELYMSMAFRRCAESLRALSQNDDSATLAAADAALRRFF